MSAPLRVRYFSWLVGVLVLYLCIQIVTLVAYEATEMHEWDAEQWKEEGTEVGLVFAVGLIILPVMMMIVWNISKRMLHPLESIAVTAERIRAGRLEERIEVPDTGDELARVAHSVNDAFDRYREAVQRVARFSSDASHQLRTPLTAIRSTGEVCLQMPRETSEYVETIGSMLEDVQRMSSIVEKLLLLARLDAGELRSRFEDVELSGIINDTVARYQAAADDKGIELRAVLKEKVMAKGDAELLHQVVANLLDNAIRYTPGKGVIRLGLERVHPSAIELTVADSGVGIPEGYRARIFERFAHAPSGKVQGTGLGLSIVSNIVELHQGSVEVGTSEEGGAVFTIRLPALTPATYSI